MLKLVVLLSAMPWRFCWFMKSRQQASFLAWSKCWLRIEKKLGWNQFQFRLDSTASQFVSGQAAEAKDFDTEFLDYVLAVKVVSSLEEAVAHIEAHSTHHSDAIVTENAEAAAYFTDQVDLQQSMSMPQLVSQMVANLVLAVKWGSLLRNCTRVVQWA